LIYPDDAKEFSTLMDVTWQSLGRNYVDKPTKQYWFGKLQKYALGVVANSFDKWIMTRTENNKDLPTIDDIIKGCIVKDDFVKELPHKRNPEVSKEGLDKIAKVIQDNIQPKTDYKAWANRILANPKYFPEYSVKCAKEALRMNHD
jgi:hypothetical protein